MGSHGEGIWSDSGSLCLSLSTLSPQLRWSPPVFSLQQKVSLAFHYFLLFLLAKKEPSRRPPFLKNVFLRSPPPWWRQRPLPLTNSWGARRRTREGLGFHAHPTALRLPSLRVGDEKAPPQNTSSRYDISSDGRNYFADPSSSPLLDLTFHPLPFLRWARRITLFGVYRVQPGCRGKCCRCLLPPHVSALHRPTFYTPAYFTAWRDSASHHRLECDSSGG